MKIQEIKDADYVISLLREALYRHSQITYTTKDSDRLHSKVREPLTDKEREERYEKMKTQMDRRNLKTTGVDPTLDRYLDMDTHVDRASYMTDPDDEQENSDIEAQFADVEDISKLFM